MIGQRWPDEPATGLHDLQTSRAGHDYLLGGKDNFAADRAAAEAGLRANPNSRIPPRENRAFLGRVVRYLAGEAGISQFLDIGTGIPTSPNVHEVAQEIQPRARIVYVDNDPIVLTQARALLTTGPGAGPPTSTPTCGTSTPSSAPLTCSGRWT
jgi:predicted O-methyltransferase YrrM